MTDRGLLVVASLPPELKEVLGREHRLVEIEEGDTDLPGYDVAVTTSVEGAGERLFSRLPDLRLLLCNGAGVDRIDLAAAARNGVTVRNTPDEVTDDTADFAIALIYATSRRLAEADRFVRSGRWKTGRMQPSRRAFCRTIGIVGLGRIGKAVARRAAAIGMTVHYTGPNPKASVPYEYVADLGELAERVDTLVLTLPGGAETNNLVGKAVLARLGPQGTLINISRGSVVNEEELIEALAAGTIKSAGLDVFANEPEIDPRFLTMENVVLAPHYAAVTTDTRYAMARALANAVREFRSGLPVYNAASRELADGHHL